VKAKQAEHRSAGSVAEISKAQLAPLEPGRGA
jgi:hypothetical protein